MTLHAVAITGLHRITKPKPNLGGSTVLALFDCEANGFTFRRCAFVRTSRRGLTVWEPDANGDPLGPFAPVMTVWAEIVWMRGSEAALGYRLERRQPVSILIRDSKAAKAITLGWRAVNARKTADKFNITAVAPARDKGFIEVLGMLGGATG